MTISIIIPVFNGAKTIRRCLNSIFRQKVASGDIEVIVVNDYSTDDTSEILHGITPPIHII